MELIKFINPKLIFLNQECSTKDEFFKIIHDKALENGFVTDEFYTKVLARENTFPTGINLGEFGVAIPHTDAEYIKEQFIAVCNFKSGVEFRSMEDENEKVNVKLAFVLGLNQPHSQLEVLQELMGIIQNSEAVKSLIECENKDEIIKIIKSL